MAGDGVVLGKRVVVDGHAEPVRNTIHIREVRNYLVHIEHASIVEPLSSETVNVASLHCPRCLGELHGVVEDCPLADAHVGRGVVVLERSGEPRVLREADQTGRMMRNSVVAFIDRRDDHTDHLALGTSDGGGAVHHRAIQINMRA